MVNSRIKSRNLLNKIQTLYAKKVTIFYSKVSIETKQTSTLWKNKPLVVMSL